ncbi:MAG: S8 family serine peptidase [Candidatus Sumerlaeaceae bacterium]
MICKPNLIHALLLSAGIASAQPPANIATSKLSALGLTTGRDQALARKFQGGLLETLVEQRRGAGLATAAGKKNQHALRDGKLQVILVVDSFSEDLLNAVNAVGLETVGTYDQPLGVKHLVVRVSSTTQLENIVSRQDVKVASIEPRPIKRTGSVTSQGDNSFRGPLARSAHGVNGTGIRVGVISDTFNRTIGGTALIAYGSGTVTGATPQTSGDLPGSVRVVDAGPTSGATDEGAGMAEIIYDVAPGSPISFASAYQSYSKFATNIAALRNDVGFQCKIVVDDIGYFAEPVYQNGLIAVAANQSAAAGVPYFSALGNDYNDAHEAVFTDPDASSSTADPPTGVDFHDFGAAKGAASDKFLTFVLRPGDTLTTVLRWDEPGSGSFAAGPGASSDLDVYILGSTALPVVSGNILDKSISAQGTVASPAGEPVEIAEYTNSTASNRTVHAVVDHYDGRIPPRMHLWAFTDGPYSNYTDRALDSDRTAYGHPCAAGAMGVAAVRYKEVDTSGTAQSPSGVINVESYSSLAGNLPFYISDDGLTRFASPQIVFKPDFTAPDGGNTTFFGGDDDDIDGSPNFYGTSAAAPHAAAVAALMLQANPALTPAQIYAHLKNTARDIAAAGVDSYAGYGLIDAKDAVAAFLVATPTAVTDWALFE